MSKVQGGLISFNNFLSTSKIRTVSLGFAKRALMNSDLAGVFFIMTIDSSQSTTPFASIKSVSYFKGEDEVLFAMQTVFRINDITSISGNPRLFQVELTLTDDNDQDLCQLTDYTRKETELNGEGWYRLGALFRSMGQYKKSEEVYQVLLEQTMNESGKAAIYGQLGLAKHIQGKYKEALTLHEKAAEIFQRNLPSNNLHLATVCNNIGNVYDNIGEYPQALLYYEKSFTIRQQSLPSAHPELATSLNNSGIVYDKMGEYPKALSYYEKSVEIKHQMIPPNHPDLASSCNNLGLLEEEMGNYFIARSLYDHAINIGQQVLPSNHPQFQKWKSHLEAVKKKLK